MTLADECISLGSIDQTDGNPYLNVALLVKVALRCGADAIHPGYGYLSENADFATAIIDAGLTFIGPSASSMATLGDKRSAKAYLLEHDATVPLIPGFSGTSQDIAELERRSDEIGYPVMLKASAGGGGKGMRVVREKSKLRAELQTTQSEAARFFGSSDCILEKYIEAGKHIEIQIIGDKHGNVVALGERDCSVQRRHQKVIEETPSPWLNQGQRQEMCDVAVRIGKLLDYDNAGTVEFVFDVATGKFYFLEVNTRLQVEHPITEEVTQLDIVALQLFVSAGGDLATLPPLRKVEPTGHAIECRLCAEEPHRDFFPSHGLVRLWRPARVEAHAGLNVRFETAVETGSRVSIHFDSMIAKIVVWAPTRSQARASMVKVLAETACVGVKTNQLFLQSCLLHAKFQDPAYTTSFIPDNFDELLVNPYLRKSPDLSQALPLIAAYILKDVIPGRQWLRPFGNVRPQFRNQAFGATPVSHQQIVTLGGDNSQSSSFLCSWPIRGLADKHRLFRGVLAPLVEDQSSPDVTARYNALRNTIQNSAWPGQHAYDISLANCSTKTAAGLESIVGIQASVAVTLNGRNVTTHVATEDVCVGTKSGITQPGVGVRALFHVPRLGTWYDVTLFNALSYFESIREKSSNVQGEGNRTVVAPMPCKVLSVLKVNGDVISVGDKIMVVESMKMEISMYSSVAGKVQLRASEQEAVEEGTALFFIE